MLNIPVCGAGPLGSLFADRLQRGGNEVSLLTPGGLSRIGTPVIMSLVVGL
ncbi:MAG: hypothetical protein PVI59_05825 [Anaerolineae bacterium]|jgi:hypothetical protein